MFLKIQSPTITTMVWSNKKLIDLGKFNKGRYHKIKYSLNHGSCKKKEDG